VSLVDEISHLWTQALGLIAKVVSPDWVSLVGLLPLFPVGEPYDIRSGLIYPPGTIQNDAGELLSVTCPMCSIARTADVTTCHNCGLVLKVDRRVAVRTLQPAGPPPGGAAAA